MSITPCGHRILIKQVELADVDEVFAKAKAIGIQLMETEQYRHQEKVDSGIVLEIGPTAFKDFGGTPWCKVGDTIAYASYAGKKVVDLETKEQYRVLNDEDVICILKQGE